MELLYVEDVIRSRTILFCLLRDYLALKRFEYTQHPANNTKIYGICFTFFYYREDRDYGLQRLANIRSGAPNAAQVAAPATHVPAVRLSLEQENDRRVTHNISQRLKKDDKIAGKLEET